MTMFTMLKDAAKGLVFGTVLFFFTPQIMIALTALQQANAGK